MDSEETPEPQGVVEQLEAESGGERLDVFLARQLGLSRSFAQRLVKEGRVERRRRGRLKPSTLVEVGDAFSVDLPPPEGLDLEPEPVEFGVVYEDDSLMVVDKPSGLVVHPAPGHWHGTLVHGLLWLQPDMGPFNNVRRPGIVHRLDAPTSGLMVVARRQEIMERLQSEFAARRVEKEYLALVQGVPSLRSGTLSGPIARDPGNRLRMAVVEGGRDSLTGYRVLWSHSGLSLVLCQLFTGRTHQIRVHLAALGHPIVGDALYGAKKTAGFDRIFLHSWRLAFKHPVTGERLSFRSPLPEELKRLLKGLENC
ncbi:MAG: RluA family pseudouridine synthase [Fretibacterium sp.]|nr:RluA family pseudouridine synthase [Fretibacterium sp.]